MTLSVDQLMARARTHERTGRLRLAARDYEEILRAFPANKRAREALEALRSAHPALRATEPPQQQVVRIGTLHAQGRQAEAEALARKALGLFPASVALWNILGVIRLAQGDAAGSEAACRKACELGPGVPEPQINLGRALKAQDRTEEAAACYAKALEIRPDQPTAWNNLGNILSDQARFDEAIDAYTRALAARPDYPQAYRNLSPLKKFTKDDPQIDAMVRLHDRADLGDSDRCDLCVALAKAFEDIGETAMAFRYLREGNALTRRQVPYEIAVDEALFARLRALDEGMDAGSVVRAEADVRPVFILGMPRSGTTLVEQIVSSHSKVTGAGELPYLSQWLRRPVAEGTEITPGILQDLRGRYLEKLAEVADGATHVTDKTPQNFRWIGIIAAAFPEAAIVHVERDPRAVCWSNYKQFFQRGGPPWCCDLGDTVAYYRLYRDLMAYWQARYADRIIRLDYQSLTEDQEGRTRDLIDRLGLDWEDACLNFQDNDRRISTASWLQVRRKIYTGSSEAWRKFEPYLGGALDDI